MVINVINKVTSEPVVEIYVADRKSLYRMNVEIYEPKFDLIPEDLVFIRTKWLTYMLNDNNFSVIYDSIISDIIKILEQDILYYNLLGDSYVVIKQEV